MTRGKVLVTKWKKLGADFNKFVRRKYLVFHLYKNLLQLYPLQFEALSM